MSIGINPWEYSAAANTTNSTEINQQKDNALKTLKEYYSISGSLAAGMTLTPLDSSDTLTTDALKDIEATLGVKITDNGDGTLAVTKATANVNDSATKITGIGDILNGKDAIDALVNGSYCPELLEEEAAELESEDSSVLERLKKMLSQLMAMFMRNDAPPPPPMVADEEEIVLDTTVVASTDTTNTTSADDNEESQASA